MSDMHKTLKLLENLKHVIKRKETQNMKFNVGDKVMVANLDRMSASVKKKYVGQVFTVAEVDSELSSVYPYILKDCDGYIDYRWSDKELELVIPKSFTKADLNDGMVVEYRNGDKALYLKNRFSSKTGCMTIDDYSDDLTRNSKMALRSPDGKPEYDIMKIYTIKPNSIGAIALIFQDKNLELIWERNEKPTYKYKPGDKVKVRSDIKEHKAYGGVGVVGDMTDFIGKVVTIKSTRITMFDKPAYLIAEDARGWSWTDEMFEGLVDYEEMTVAEIEEKLGYKVKIVDGE